MERIKVRVSTPAKNLFNLSVLEIILNSISSNYYHPVSKEAGKFGNYKEIGFMHILRFFGLVLLSFMLSASPAPAATGEKANDLTETETVKNQEQIIEAVDIAGNRRLRDEDLLYYIKTRPGDVYIQAQLERDLRELLQLNFFDKVETKVLTEPGVRGGVNVIFQVVELPIIRDLQFEGLEAVPESDVLKAFANSASAFPKNRFTIRSSAERDAHLARTARLERFSERESDGQRRRSFGDFDRHHFCH
jgi:outer membrane protein assembly factor BamA